MTVRDLLPTTESSAAEGPTRIRWLGWAAYLGASWTWCIGMFLPVLLVRDFGFWGWLVFAIPNVVGAAAMGTVMNSRERSRRVIEQHLLACVAFSLVTVIFHVFFASWFVYGAIGIWALPALIAVALLAWFIGSGRQRGDIAFAAIALLVSSAIFVTSVVLERFHPAIPNPLNMDHGAKAIPLAFVCIFGFALCPYLDLTFHRARLETNDSEARSAFQIGFGGFFFAMILFTLWYSRFLITTTPAPGFAIAIVGLLVVHVLIQSGLTCALHFREVTRQVNRQLATVFLLLVAASVIFFAAFHTNRGETIYRCFMAFYGLAFPAYAWLCMIRYRRKPMLSPLTVFVIATLAASPFYWLAFIDGKMGYVFPGLVIVLLARGLLYIPRGETLPAVADS